MYNMMEIMRLNSTVVIHVTNLVFHLQYDNFSTIRDTQCQSKYTSVFKKGSAAQSDQAFTVHMKKF